MRFRARRVCRFAIAVVFAASLVPATLARAQAAQAGGGSGAVAGSVAVRQSGQPVPGAVVSLEGTSLTAVSNQTGRFRIDSVPPGSVMLVVRAPGFLDAHAGAVQVRAGDTAQIDVELEATPNFLERMQVTAAKMPLWIGEVAAQADIVDRADHRAARRPNADAGDPHVPGAVVSARSASSSRSCCAACREAIRNSPTRCCSSTACRRPRPRNGARVVGLTINDASDIEVVRGPNSALYGRTAIGGSVNMRTADPTSTPELGVDSPVASSAR